MRKKGDFERGMVVGARFQKLLIYWDFHSRVYRERSEKNENIQWTAVLWVKMPCWCKRSEENGQTCSTL